MYFCVPQGSHPPPGPLWLFPMTRSPLHLFDCAVALRGHASVPHFKFPGLPPPPRWLVETGSSLLYHFMFFLERSFFLPPGDPSTFQDSSSFSGNDRTFAFCKFSLFTAQHRFLDRQLPGERQARVDAISPPGSPVPFRLSTPSGPLPRHCLYVSERTS